MSSRRLLIDIAPGPGTQITKMEKPKEKIKHIAITMDGVSAWAQERNLQFGHGLNKSFVVLANMVGWLRDSGLTSLSVLLYSPEDYEAARDDISQLLKKLSGFLSEQAEELNKDGVRLLFTGDFTDLPGDLPEAMLEAEKKTQLNSGLILNLCLNYSGRQEIVEAVKKLFAQNPEIEQIHSGMLKKHFYRSALPDPDKVVVTGAQNRLKDFFLWQSARSELVFTKKLWPELEREDLLGLLQ